MAIAGSGGWTPSNLACLRNGKIHFVAITQNKPPDLIPDVEVAAETLRTGGYVNVDVRWPYMSRLRQVLEVSQ